MMLFLLLTLFALNGAATGLGCTCCDERGIRIYEEIGCEPVKNANKLCPDYYKCPDFNRGDDFCMFGGNYYKLDQRVNGSSNCRICECKRTFVDGKLGAGVQCYPQSGCKRNHRIKDCTNSYSIDQCCPTGFQCYTGGNDFECKVDGICYKEGQKFIPRGSCYECVCQRGFTGTYEAPYCRRRRCDVEVYFSDEIRANCAPVYDPPGVHEAMCCPHRFVCPADDCKIEMVNVGFPDCNTCYFGKEPILRNASFYVRKELLGGRSSALCTCTTPPLLTCVGN